MKLLIKYLILFIFFFVFVNTSRIGMEDPIYNDDEIGMRLRKIINKTQILAIMPSNNLKEYHFQNRKICTVTVFT